MIVACSDGESLAWAIAVVGLAISLAAAVLIVALVVMSLRDR